MLVLGVMLKSTTYPVATTMYTALVVGGLLIILGVIGILVRKVRMNA